MPDDFIRHTNTGEEKDAVKEVRTNYEAAFLAKEDVGVQSDLADLDDYWAGRQVSATDEDDPASNVNIILPVIEGQISDLIDEPLDIYAEGWEPSDIPYSDDVQTMLRWIWYRNKMLPRIDRFERQRLKFGTGIWHTYYDPVSDMPLFRPVNPANFFPDPKVSAADLLEEADFIIVAIPRSLAYLRRKYGDIAKAVKPETNPSYNPQMFTGENADSVSAVLNSKALVITQYAKDDKGQLYVKTVAGDVVLRDSRKERDKPFYRHNRQPFSVVPCYPREGILWGMGDVELLKPIQDAVNDFDDQIRMNARLMGNLQVVVGIASGINPFKWTNKPGLKIPARDPSAWQAVQPQSIPAYIAERRYALLRESEMVSGRSDVVEGRKPSGVEAAAAIAALQQAGMRRVRHKRIFLQDGLSDAMEQALEIVKEEWTEERAFRILGKTPDYKWFRASDLTQTPLLGQDGNPIMSEGQMATKDAKFDIRVTMGTGLMMNSYMAYQTALAMAQSGLITRDEARLIAGKALGWPIMGPPQGEWAPMKGVTPTAGGVDMTQAGNALQGLPPQIMEQVMALAQGAGQ